jgi:tryptophan synthase alpha chain
MSRALLHAAIAEAPFHVSPFLVIGDPTPELSPELAQSAVEAGATMLELGFPYGDPCADGPAVHAANVRALRRGTSTQEAFELLARIRKTCPRTPLNLLVYGNLVHRRGPERFARDAAAAGASSLLVPDVPLEEGTDLRRACRLARLGHCELVGPRTSEDRLRRLDRVTDAFVYLVAHQGVTGVREGDVVAQGLVRRVATMARNPVCLGFGLSRPEHVRAARAAGARIAVVGSALAELIGRTPEGELREKFAAAVGELTAATHVGQATPEPSVIAGTSQHR